MANIMRLGGGGGGNQYVWDKYAIKLPNGYTPVEYIESSGEQYIDTGFYANQNSSVSVKFSTTQQSGGGVVAAMQAWQNRGFGVFVNAILFGSSAKDSTGLFGDGQIHEVKLNSEAKCYDNGQLIWTGTVSTFTTPTTLTICKSNVVSEAHEYSSAKIYACQIYDNGTLVRDYVPCKNASGVAGLYDLANDAFYTNAGSGTFAVGNPYGEGNVKGEYIGQVKSTDANAYPFMGVQDGYYYEAVGGTLDVAENGVYDVRQYAVAEVNIPPAAPVLLWTNASPGDFFAQQTLNVPSDYSGYLVELRYSAGNDSKTVCFMNVGSGTKWYPTSQNTQLPTTRQITPYNGSIVFGAGADSYGNQSSGYAIPTRIWGVKFTL